MIETREEQDLYLSHFTSLKEEGGKRPSWVQKLRKNAMESFAELGFPATKNEDWKYTNVSSLAKVAFTPVLRAPVGLTRHEIDQMPLARLECKNRLVFVNGRFSQALSSACILPKELNAGSLAAALESGGETLERHLARYARYEDRPFVALNTAFLQDGALVEIPKGLILEEPMHLLFISLPAAEPVIFHPRNLILAGSGSQATVIETHLGIGEGVYFNNVVTEIVAGEGAVLDHYKLQQESEQAFHVATVQVLQERSSTLCSHNVSFGAALTRNDTNSVLDAEGAGCTLNGLFVATGRQHVDNHTWLDHAKPHCTSLELYKGILNGRAAGVFNGKIMVRKDAQKTNAIQSNKNLLLSENAVINTKPQLEIYADDVRCTHGATVGQLDQDALFYMRSRGIERQEARDLLTYAFAGDVLDRMKWEPASTRLEETLYLKLSKDRQGSV
jgi:Fe-S cluster assembly protein SufD